MNLLSPFFSSVDNWLYQGTTAGVRGKGAGDRNNQLSFSIKLETIHNMCHYLIMHAKVMYHYGNSLLDNDVRNAHVFLP